MIVVPKKVVERVSKQLPAFQRVLASAKDRDVNESDTVTIVKDMLAGVFGYDKYSEVTSELAIRGTYCDLAVKIDGSVKYLIEVKAIGLTLKENHLRQAIGYGASQGIQWVVLTNGADWEIHRILFEKPLASEQVCTLSLLDLNARKADDQSMLFILCKEGLRKAAIEHFHERAQNVNRFVLGALVLSDPVVGVVRRELRRLSPGMKIETDEIRSLLAGEVLKRDVVEGDAAKDAQKRVKRAGKKTLRKRKTRTAKLSRRKEGGAEADPPTP